MNLREEFEKKWAVDMNQIFDESIGKYIPPHRTHELNIRWEAFQYAHELWGKDAERLVTLMDAAGRDYEALAAHQLIGRLREGIDELATASDSIASNPGTSVSGDEGKK